MLSRLLVVVVPALLAGCGPSGGGSALTTQPGHPGHRATAPDELPTTGTIKGTVVRGRGQDPRSGAAGPSSTVPVSGDPVEVRQASGKVAVRLVSAPDGSFHASLPEGTYMVGEDIANVSQEVQVRRGSVIVVTLRVPAA